MPGAWECTSVPVQFGWRLRQQSEYKCCRPSRNQQNSGSALEDPNLPEKPDLIVEQILLHNLAVLPMRDRAEL